MFCECTATTKEETTALTNVCSIQVRRDFTCSLTCTTVVVISEREIASKTVCEVGWVIVQGLHVAVLLDRKGKVANSYEVELRLAKRIPGRQTWERTCQWIVVDKRLMPEKGLLGYAS